MTTAETLRKAKSLIDHPSRHLRYVARDGHGRYCAVGAVRKATERMAQPPAIRDYEPIRLLDCAAKELFGVHHESVRDELWANRLPVTPTDDGYAPCEYDPRTMIPAVLVNNLLGWSATMEMFDYAIKLAERDDQ